MNKSVKYKYAVIVVFLMVKYICADPALVITPAQMDVPMPDGGLEIREVEVLNAGKSTVKVEANYDTTWLDVSPKRIDISAGGKKKFTIFIFIPDNDKSEHQGFVELLKSGEKKTSRLYIRAGNINFSLVNNYDNVISAGNSIEKFLDTNLVEKADIDLLQDKVKVLKQQVTQDSMVIKSLQEELKNREIQFVELTQSMQNKEEFDFYTIPNPGGNKGTNISGDLQSLYDYLVTALHNDIVEGNITLTWYSNKLCYTLTGKSAFISGSDYLRLRGEEVLNRFALALKKQKQNKFHLMIIGHTDSVPFPNEFEKNRFSNWELSALRSARVAKMLQAVSGYDGKNLISASQSCYAPVTENNTPEGRMQNRRVDIFISVADK